MPRPPRPKRVLLAAAAAALVGHLSWPHVYEPMPTAGAQGATPAALSAAPRLQGTPHGALAPARPIWCEPSIATGRGTFITGPNSWVDNFDHGLSNADIGPGYVAFQNHEGTGAAQIPLAPDGAGFWIESGQHFRHANHWMTDVLAETESYGGHLLRPARAFRFQGGRLVVEMDVAAGIEEYRGNAWPEIFVATLDRPTLPTVTDTNARHMFRGGWVAGCKLGPGGHVFCGVVGPDGKLWEVSPQEDGSEAAAGVGTGYPGPGFRVCRGADPDLACRDRFRLELERDRFALFVNGQLYLERRGLPDHLALPPALLDAEVYAYAASWVWKLDRNRPIARFHWDRLAVNPEGGPAAPAGTDTPPPVAAEGEPGAGAP